MLSPQSQRIRAWLFQQVKSAAPAATVPEARERIDTFGKRLSLSEEASIQPVKYGDIYGEWVQYGAVYHDKALLYFHGGGYIMGSCQSSRVLTSLLSKAAKCPVLSIDYRLAPEHPFPAALDDAASVYRSLLREQALLPENVILVGDSAGGGLALAALLFLREAEAPLPAGAVLICPWLDLTGSVASRTSKADCDPWYNCQSIENQAAQMYAGENDLKNPFISPLYAELNNLPPMFIQVGTDDIYQDDSLQLFEKGTQSGIDIHLDIWEGMWHVWHNFALSMPEGEDAINKIGAFIQGRFGIV